VRFELSLSQEECSLENLIAKVLDIARNQCGNNISQAAKLLKIDRKMFYRRC
jgi:transcriptional regulator of acetoin/glycerol metabolism